MIIRATIFVLLLASNAIAATVYIHPSGTAATKGASTGDCAACDLDPSTCAGLTDYASFSWVAGDVQYFCNGSYGNILLKGSGDSNENPLYVYFDPAGITTTQIQMAATNYMHFNPNGGRAQVNGLLYIHPAVDLQGIRVYNVDASNSSGTAAVLIQVEADRDHSLEVQIHNSTFTNSTGNGVAQTSKGGLITAKWYNCTFSGNNSDDSNENNGVSIILEVFTHSSGWTCGGTTPNIVCYKDVDTDKGTGPWVDPTIVSYGPANSRKKMTQNTSTPTTPDIDEWGYSGTTVYVNTDADPPGTVLVSYGQINVEFWYCTFGGVADNEATGFDGNNLYFDYGTTNSGVYYSRLYGAEGSGIAMWMSDDIEIVGNLIYENFQDSGNSNGCGIHIREGVTNTAVYFNTFVDHRSSIRCWYPNSGTVTLTNNIFMTNTEYGIALDTAGNCTIVEENNLFYDNTIDRLNVSEGSSPVYSDPLFLDATNDNYRLTSTSPAIDAGTPITGFALDHLLRPRLGTPDIGAYEYFWVIINGTGTHTITAGGTPLLK